jgi:hypothetical protein
MAKIAVPPCTFRLLHYLFGRLLGCSCIFSDVLFSHVGWQQQRNYQRHFGRIVYYGAVQIEPPLFCLLGHAIGRDE